VKPHAVGTSPAFAYFPLDGNVEDYSGNHRDAQMFGVDAVADVRGEPAKAYLFNSGSDIIYMGNTSELNFQNAITLSFWVNLSSLSEESFILSHGSWEERWKVSVTPDAHLRWTIKTNSGTRDLDSSFPLTLNHFYHFAVVYSGYSMELYVDGNLDACSVHAGLMSTTNKSLTFGRKDATVTSYGLRGTLDEVRIYNATVFPEEISTWKTTWNTIITGIENTEINMSIYPNPIQRDFYITGISIETIKNINIFDPNGQSVNFIMTSSREQLQVTIENRASGLLILEVQTTNGLYHRKIILK
jgi:hypothetical protein